MEESTDHDAARAAGLIDELVRQHRELSVAQARCAALMLEFADARSVCDRRVIAHGGSAGADGRYTPGEFAGTEIGMAVRESKYAVQRTMGIARRLRTETPDVWDAWQAGDINHDKAERINRTLIRLVRDNSKALLNAVVVDVAVCKTGELLGRWLNQFVARVEPDEQDERIRRSLADRYVSVRPDLDGVSFLSAALSSLDAAAIDRVLTAIAAVAAPGDTRTLQQRRADALVDVLLGRIGNGCHRWDGADDAEAPADLDCADHPDDDPDRDPIHHAPEHRAADHPGGEHSVHHRDASGGGNDTIDDAPEQVDTPTGEGAADNTGCEESAVAADPANRGTMATGAPEAPADPDITDDWDLPASAFRPDPPHRSRSRDIGPDRPGHPPSVGATPGAADPPPCTCGGTGATARPTGVQVRPVQVNIGVIISAAALFGFTNTPGQLADRSALIPADTIRDLAARPGTLFHRLVTDSGGNLLQVTELGRFPSKKLAMTIGYRDGVCNADTCHVSAARGDIDHIIPVPEGPTTAGNLKARCRKDHRAKTHAGHLTERTGPHTTQWTTPSGHTYTSHDDPLPVEEFPTDATDPTPTPTPRAMPAS